MLKQLNQAPRIDTLAKLMATENLNILYKKVSTAAFDTKTRTLIMPIFKKTMSKNIADLFTGHEVGHALYTPHDESDIFIKANRNKKSFFSYLNIVEDARIEKLIKNRYPGLKTPFFDGYTELHKKNFFGILERDVDTLGLMDRINVHFKMGIRAGVSFTSEEQKFVDEINSALTFSQICDIVLRLYDFCKKQKEQELQDKKEEEQKTKAEAESSDDSNDSNDSDDDSSDDSADDSDDSDDDSSDDSADDDDDSESNDTAGNDDADNTSDDNDNEEDTDADSKNADNTDKENDSDSESENTSDDSTESQEDDEDADVEPDAPITDENDSDRMSDFIDDSDDLKENLYVTVSDKLPEACMVNYKDCQKNLGDYLVRYNTEKKYSNLQKAYARFQKQNMPVVNHLIKEFNMKKSADAYKRTSISKSGVIDTNRLINYKISDDIFKRFATVNDGQNHGLVMFVDWSGSMSGKMTDTIQQLLTLVSFARKANIPFDVYSFNDRNRAGDLKHGDYKEGDLIHDYFCLRQYFSSKMNANEFNKAMFNMFIVGESFKSGNNRRRYSRSNRGIDIPSTERLGCTPLNSAVIASYGIINRFKKDNNIQIVNAIFLTDGGATDALGIMGKDGESYRPSNARIITLDKKTKKTYELDIDNTNSLLEYVGKSLDVNIIGFYITGYHDCAWTATRLSNDNVTDFHKELDENNYIAVTSSGYTEFYIIPSGKGLVDTDKFTPDNTMTKEELTDAFTKFNKSKLSSRKMLSRFIDLIS